MCEERLIYREERKGKERECGFGEYILVYLQLSVWRFHAINIMVGYCYFHF